jgi:hypothetical protein
MAPDHASGPETARLVDGLLLHAVGLGFGEVAAASETAIGRRLTWRGAPGRDVARQHGHQPLAVHGIPASTTRSGIAPLLPAVRLSF